MVMSLNNFNLPMYVISLTTPHNFNLPTVHNFNLPTPRNFNLPAIHHFNLPTPYNFNLPIFKSIIPIYRGRKFNLPIVQCHNFYLSTVQCHTFNKKVNLPVHNFNLPIVHNSIY